MSEQWKTPKEELPPDGECVLAIISGNPVNHSWISYKAAVEIVSYSASSKQWYVENGFEEWEHLVVHCWKQIDTSEVPEEVKEIWAE